MTDGGDAREDAVGDDGTRRPRPARSWRREAGSRPRSTPGCSAWSSRSPRSGSRFNILSGGDFLTARNLWNLSVQSTSIADHGDGHGAHHRVAQHRPLGRVAARLPRLRDGPGPDRRDLRRSSASTSPPRPANKAYVWIIALAFGLAARRARRRRPGLHRRLRRGARVHRHARRVPRLARPDLPHGRQAGPDALPAQRHVPAARRRRRRGSLGDWRSWLRRAPRLRRHRRSASCSPGGVASATSSPCARCGSRSGSAVVGCVAVLAGGRAGGQPVHLADHRQSHRASPTRSSSSSS